jgi:hypothetical protein
MHPMQPQYMVYPPSGMGMGMPPYMIAIPPELAGSNKFQKRMEEFIHAQMLERKMKEKKEKKQVKIKRTFTFLETVGMMVFFSPVAYWTWQLIDKKIQLWLQSLN